MFKTWRKNHPPSVQENTTELKTTELKENPLSSLIVNGAARDNRQILRGPKLRFLEDAHYNLELIKFLVPAPELVFETFLVGNSGTKQVVLVYLSNVANPGIVAEVKNRIKRIKTRTLLDSSYLQRNIEDSGQSPFPQVEITNRPDSAQNALWQGRVALILDGSPDILLAPCTLFELVDTSDDAYSRWFFAASFFKVARYIMLLAALCLPGFYIALLSYNPQLLPTRMLLSIVNSREGTPFPIYFETFLMMGVAEAIRMMLIRVPSQLGSTIALFSGIALILAGLYSHMIGSGVVIIATLTIIASFGIPDYDLRSAIRIFQFFTMIMSSFLGLFGFAAAFFMICIHLVNLKSFGIPYMTPLAPIETSGWGHTILREDTVKMPVDETYRPQHIEKSRLDNE
ncbi:MAG TPA: spore germination protein [Bacillota bacterium]|nr:spore germination protein [Bacillota bacterium]